MFGAIPMARQGPKRSPCGRFLARWFIFAACLGGWLLACPGGWPAGRAVHAEPAAASAPPAAPDSATVGWQVRALLGERSGPPGSLLTFPFEVQPPAAEPPPPPGPLPASPAQPLAAQPPEREPAEQTPILLCPQADPGWEPISPPRRLSQAQLEAARRQPLRVLVTVRVPSGRAAGARGEVRLRVAEGEGCEAPSRILAEAFSYGVVAPQRELELQAEGPGTAAPGRRWSGRVILRNPGNQDEEVALAVRSNLHWPAWAQPERVKLPAFGESTVTLAVQVPEEAGAGLVLLLTVEAATPDGSLRRQIDVRVVVDWPGARIRGGPQEERVLRGQLGLGVDWPARAATGTGAPPPSATANLRLGARLPQGSWEAGVSGNWSPQAASLSWPWVVATDPHGQTWGLGTGSPGLPSLLGQRISGASSMAPLASLSMPRPSDGRLRFGLLGGADGGLLVVERMSLTSAAGRRWALAAGSLRGVATLEAEGRLAVWRQQDRFADLVATAAWGGAGAGAVGLEVGSSVWKAGLRWDELAAGFVGSPSRSTGVRLEGWVQPAQGRSAAAWVQRRLSEGGSASSESLEFGVRVQPAPNWALQWQQRQSDISGFSQSRTLNLFLRGGPPGASWFALVSAEQSVESPGEWQPKLQAWFPVGRAAAVLWQPSVAVERRDDGLWKWTASAWARYERRPGRLALLVESSVSGLEGSGVSDAALSVALERAFSPWLAGRFGLSTGLTPSSPPSARLVAGFTYLFAVDLPEPRGTVRGRLVGWQERDPTFRWPALPVQVDGEVAGQLQPDGTFVLREVPAGRRRIELDARQFPAMWIPPAAVEVEVAADRDSVVELPVVGAGVLEGLCFADLNEDGRRQPEEPAFGGCAVQASLPDGPALSVGSDASGRWQLSGVRPGRYVVRAVGSGFPEAVRQAAGQLAPWLVVLARMGGSSNWTWQGDPATVDLPGWPQVARLEVGLRPPVSAPQAGPPPPTGGLDLKLQVEPETAPPGAELRVQVQASSDLAEVELAVGQQRLRLQGAGNRREAWVVVPDRAGAGVLEVAVRALDTQGRQEEQRAVVLVDPQVPLLRAQLRPAVVRAGQPAELELEALARLTNAVVQTPWGELAMVPEGQAPSTRWRAALAVPADAAAGLHTLMVRGQTVAGQEVQTTLRLRVRR